MLRVHRRTGFTQVPNEVLRDQRLSWKARGVLCYLLSHSDGYRFNRDQLAAEAPDGVTAVRSALAELTAAGYYRVQRRKGDDGRFVSTVQVTDTPGTWPGAAPLAGFPPPADAPPGSPPVEEHQSEQHCLKSAEPAAVALTRDWWEQHTPRPMIPFVGARKIVDKALTAGWSAEQVRRALRNCGPQLAAWRLDKELRALPGAAGGPRHLGGFDPEAANRAARQERDGG